MNEPDVQRAEELASMLQRAEAGQEPPLAETTLDPKDVDLAVQLVQLASAIEVDHDFASTLEADLRSTRGMNAQASTRAGGTHRTSPGGATGHRASRLHTRLQPPDGPLTQSARHKRASSQWKWRV